MRQDAGGGFIILCLLFLLIYHPNHLLLLASPSTSCHPHQRDALLRFIRPFSIDHPSYPFEELIRPFPIHYPIYPLPDPVSTIDCYHQNASYPKVASWREGKDCCSWEGITCDNSTGDVVGLDLTCARLCGSINSSSPLFSLRHLRHLSLAGNDLLGSAIPPEIGMFTRLEYLDLSHSNISGILPTKISLLSKMVSLDLSDNSWLEMQDHTMRMLASNLTQLEELNLGSVVMFMVNPTSFMNLSSSLISLKLSGCLLNGNFHEFIFGLPNLQVIDISWNVHLTGTLPKSMWSPSLDYLSLIGCSFTGAVPNSIGNLSRLTYLDLSESNFTGAVPNSIGNLSRLTYLDLSQSNYTGAVPNSIRNLSRLTYLDLSQNNFTGDLDLGILSTLEDLQILRLSGISVSGEDAKTGCSLPKLQELSMLSCNMSKFPSFLSRSMELRFLFLSGNKIQEIPSWLWSIGIDALSELYLDGNLIKGSIPPSICQLTSLSNVDLSGNYLTGIIPQCLGNLTILRWLDLSNNSLSGKLPMPSFLSDIQVRNNHFSGSIPPSICQLTSQPEIDLSQNDLTGAVPPCIGNLTSLVLLNLGDNLLSGSLPTSLANCTSLTYLDVSYNNISGAPPTWLSMSSIYQINLRDNNFGGQWPPDISLQSGYIDLSNNRMEGSLPVPSSATYSYSVSNNHFSGEISSLVCNATNLQFLDLSNNSLMGTLPDCLKNVTVGLLYLNLRANKFGGQIPEIFHEGSHLISVDLSRNQFEGSLPRSLSNCRSLGSLDVGNNKITCSFPSWLGDLPLKVLSLRSNNFHGRVIISMETHNFSQVRILDLSNNNFVGIITSKFIGELLGMTRYNTSDFPDQYMRPYDGIGGYYSVMIDLKGVETEMVKINVRFAMLDLSSNQFHGEIPKSIELLKSLKGLNFSHNSFTGTIPSSVGNLTNLESLNLSSNHLIGEIPKELVKLTFLGFLNLSRNNLTGPIPQGGHFNTFTNSSFQGNPGLCGIPLTRSCDQGNKGAKLLQDGKEGGGWLEWEYVVLGFGTGMGMGISLGYMVLELGRPLWLVRVVIRLETCYRNMSKRKKGDQ